MSPLMQHPQLAGCRRLFLRDHEVRINIGVHDFEKQGEQRVLINVDLFVPLEQSTPQIRTRGASACASKVFAASSAALDSV